MQLTKIGGEDRLRKHALESTLAHIDLVIRRHRRIQQVLRVLRPRNHSKGKALAKQCLAKLRVDVDDAVGERRHGGISAEIIQVLDRMLGRYWRIRKALSRIVLLCIAQYAGTKHERHNERPHNSSVVLLAHHSCAFSFFRANEGPGSVKSGCLDHTRGYSANLPPLG